MRSEEIRADMLHEARMCAEYAALSLWDEAARRARSYKRLQQQLEVALLAPEEPAPAPPAP